MEKRILLSFLLILIVITSTACTNKLEKGFNYLKEGELEKAETIFNEMIISDDENLEAYDGLIQVYRKKNQIDNMARVLELALSKGYTPKDDSYYMDVFNYYKDLGDSSKLESFLEKVGEDKLPKEALGELVLAKHPEEKGEIIDTKYGDIDGDGRDEMMVLSVTKMDVSSEYDYVYFRIYELATGRLKYEEEIEIYPCIPSDLTVGDFTKDGIPEVHFTITMLAASNSADFDYIISFQDGEFRNIYTLENRISDVGYFMGIQPGGEL